MRYFVKKGRPLPPGIDLESGWGNGYALIPPQHPLHGKSYDEIYDLMPELEVHGGLTFAEEVPMNWPEIPEGAHGDEWCVGFDTGHYEDTEAKWPKERVIEEARYLAEQLEDFTKSNNILIDSGRIDLRL